MLLQFKQRKQIKFSFVRQIRNQILNGFNECVN